MTNVTIKRARIEDLETLLSWRMEVLREVFSLPMEQDTSELEQESRAYYENALQTGGHIACLALVNGQVAGCGGVCIYREMPSPDNKNGLCAYLMNIYTRPPFRNQGVAKTVMAWLMEQARQKGIGKIYLETTEKAHPFYTGLGFRSIENYLISGA